MTAEALRVESCGVRYGGVVALDDVSFVAHEGEVLGFIGPNGAGKTTLFDVVSGFVRPTSGRILLGDLDVTAMNAEARARAGLGRSFQDARLFSSLTVKENLQVAFERHLAIRSPLAVAGGLMAQREEEASIAARAEELIDLLGIGAFRDKFASELSTGSRRIVDLAMVLAHRPAVLLLDEPSSGIAQRETEALGPLIRRIRAQLGCTVLVIEHDMPLVSAICDAVIALEAGRTIASGTARQVLHDPRVVSAYLGGDVATINRSGAAGSIAVPETAERLGVAADPVRIPRTPRLGALRPRRVPSWAQRSGVAASVLLAATCLILAHAVHPETPRVAEYAAVASPAPVQAAPASAAPTAATPAMPPALPLVPPAAAAQLPAQGGIEPALPAPQPSGPFDEPTPPASPSPSVLDQLCLAIPLAVCPSPLPDLPVPAPTAPVGTGLATAPSSAAGSAPAPGQADYTRWLRGLVFSF